jgi:predicted GNAT family acetyltransferase
VQRADRGGGRWQIANVAVAPAYRGRGISRQLMAQALEHIRLNGGQWAVLQVYEKNTIARSLYERMGFEVVSGSVDLRLERTPKVAPTPPIQNLFSFSPNQWQPLYDLANLQYGTQAQWWRSLRRLDFQLSFEQHFLEWLGRVAGRSRVYRRCIQSYRHHFDAALVLTAMRWHGTHGLQLWVRPEHYGRHEEPLIHWALATLQEYPRWPVTMNLHHEHVAALTAAQQVGFRIQQTLLTMRCKVE